MDKEQNPTSLLTETLPGMDTPIIPRTVDLNTISQQETDSYRAVAAQYFVNYFVEGMSPTSDVLRANERVGPRGAFKVLVACNVTRDVWERRFANDRCSPRLELDNDRVYIFSVSCYTHGSVHGEVVYQLHVAMKTSGIPPRLGCVFIATRGDYSNETTNETIVITPDIVIKSNKQTIAVLEVEVTHRSVPALRAHAQRIFDGNGDVKIVGVLKVHRRRPDNSFAAEFVAWRRGGDDGTTIQCLPDCVHDFGTAPSSTAALNEWRNVEDVNALETVVPENIHFIQQESRAPGEERRTFELPVADVLRVALNGIHAADSIVPFNINLTRIVECVEDYLSRVLGNN